MLSNSKDVAMINGLELNKFSELHGILVTLRSAELESPVICAFVSLSPSFYKLLAFSIFLSRTTGPSTELMGEVVQIKGNTLFQVETIIGT